MRVMVFVVTETIRAAVRDAVRHPAKDRLRTLLRRDCDVAGDSAHRWIPGGWASKEPDAWENGQAQPAVWWSSPCGRTRRRPVPALPRQETDTCKNRSRMWRKLRRSPAPWKDLPPSG